jgi:methyltransferase (TIGR00027 family)
MANRKTSATAYLIADSISKLSQTSRWRNYIPATMKNLNTVFATHIEDTLAKRFLGALPLWLSIWIMDTFYIPGMTYHYLFRKLLIEEQLEKAVQVGIQQVIILGAGFDTLAIRDSSKYPTISFFEIDLPNTQNVKIDILNKVNYEVPKNCIFKAADLSNMPLQSVLSSIHGFSSEKPTFVIIEGVLMYLSEPEVKVLFTDLNNLIKSNLTIIFGAVVTPDYSKNWRIKFISWLLGRGQENTKWTCSSTDIPQFMTKLGYETQGWIPYKKLQSIYRKSGEVKYVPEEDENYYVVSNKAYKDKSMEIESIPLIYMN